MIRNQQENENSTLFRNIRDSMPEIMTYIDENATAKITLEETARKYFYSPSYFSRLFKQRFSVTFSQYLQSKRIEHAICLMADPSLSIEQISERVGYDDKREFYRTFKKVISVTPNSYRSKNKTSAVHEK